MITSQIRFGLALGSAFLVASVGHPQSFSPGNLAILRVGNGTETLVSSGNSLFIDQYTTNGSFLSTVSVPDSGTGALLLSGASSSEGGLTRSMDRSMLVIAGYDTNRGSVSGSLSSQSAALVPRAVSTIDAFATYHLAGASTSLYSSNNIRCAASDGTNNFWTAGNPGGTYFFNPPQAPVEVQTSGANTRQVKIIDGALYFSTQAGTAGLYTFPGGGLPKSAATAVLLFGTGANSQPAGFALNSTLTTAYVADQRPTAGGIQKWTNSGTAWSLAYSFSTGAGAYDVAADFSGSSPVIYATTAEASSNRLVSIVDTGAPAMPKLLVSAGGNRIFKGLDFVPDLRPVIVGQPQSQSVTNGSQVSFEVLAQSLYPLNYQWQKNGTNLSAASASSLTLQAVSSADAGSYRAIVTNRYGSITSAVATLSVNQALILPAFTSQPSSQSISLGGSATFSVAVTGTPPLTYQWQFNGAALAGETNSSLVLINLSAKAQGSYLVRVSNLAGSTNSQPANLAVLIPPSSFVAYSAPGLVYSQTFDSLPNPGTAGVNADNPVTIGANTYGLANPFDFSFPILGNSVDGNTGIGLGGLGLSNTMPGWYGLGQASPKFGASAGDQSTGGVISFGLTNSLNASSNRALGLLATSSTGGTAFGLKLVNQTTNTLSQITVHFTGELWRQAAVPKLLSFSYWIDPTATNTFSTNTTTVLTNLDFGFAVNVAATNPFPVDGTAPANQLSLGATNQQIVNWLPGAALWLTWQMPDFAGKGQGLAIDDLVFWASAPQAIPPAQLSIRQSGTNAVLFWPASLSGYTVQGNANLSQTNAWSQITQPVTLTNGENSVVVPISSADQFYRLKK